MPARLGARHVWVVDPIDGTRAYIAGQPDWAISAALVEDGRPIAACLYAPALDEFFAARAGAGSMLNGTPIATTPGADLQRYSRRRSAEISRSAEFGDAAVYQAAPRTFAGAAACPCRARRAPMWRLPAATVTIGTLRQPIFWCTKRAARSRPWRAELWSIIVPCRGMGRSSQPAGTGTRRSSNFLGIKSFLGTRIFLGTRASHCDNRKPGGRIKQYAV